MKENYWSNVLKAQISRRRTLAATGATAAAAALLAACGGGSSSSSSSSGPAPQGSGLLAKPEDTSKTAKRGGTMKWVQANEPLHFDGQAQGQAQLNIYNGMVYESLVRNKPGTPGEPSSFTEVLPNLAESWEFSPDKTQITFKIRQGVKWQNIPPVSGRAFEASDVVDSTNRYVGVPTPNNKAVNFNSVNPNSPILSVTAPDSKTVVYKLKEPTSYIMQRLTTMITGELGAIYPREADHGYDPRKDQIGTGGYIRDSYRSSEGLTYKRNPEYWNKDAVYPDVLEIPFLNQYPALLAQFKTGAVYAVAALGTFVPTDIVPTKKDVPALNMYSYIGANNNTSYIQRMGWQDMGGKKSPFLDQRVRQAMSMAIDRDAYIDAFSNVSKFKADGLPVDTYYHTSMGYLPGVTLDPRDTKTFGPNAKYYTRDLAEAKKLLAAAGYASGFEYDNHWPNFAAFGAAFPNQVTTMESFMAEIGLKAKNDPIDYNLKYLPDYVTKRGQHQGVAFTLGAVTSPDPIDYFVWRYYSKSGATSGAVFGDVGSGAGAGDPKVDDFIEKAKAETDASKQKVILGDLQRYLAEMQYAVASPGIGTSFDLAWPAVKNYLALQGDSRAINSFYYTWWLDDTQAPLKKT